MITGTTFGSFEISSESSRRVSITIDVIEALRRHCARTSPPMKPVQPDRMIFMLAN